MQPTKRVYDHNRYAGNQGDAWKHFVLVEVLRALAPRVYAETHAGPGECALVPGGEWERGFGRLLADGRVRGAWLDTVRAHWSRTQRYLGSWRLAVEPGRRLVLCETSEAAREQARACDVDWSAIELRAEDGFAADLTGAELLLVDPPYKVTHDGSPDDWAKVPMTVAAAAAAGAEVLVWYPVFWHGRPRALVEATGLHGYELWWGDLENGQPGYETKGCGMLATGRAEKALETMTPRLEELAAALGGRLVVRRSQRA